MRFSLFLILLFISSGQLLPQPQRQWVQRYNGPANLFDIVSNMQLDEAGNSYVFGGSNGVGSLSDFVIVKYDASGNEIWTARYNGLGNSTDQINYGVIDSSGNSYVTGFITDSNLVPVMTTAVFNSTGQLQWIRYHSPQNYSNGFGQRTALDSKGNFVVCGYIRDLQANYDMAILKYNRNGDLIHQTTFQGSNLGGNIPSSMKIDNEDNILILGETKTLSNGVDIILLKFDSSLNLLWMKSFNGSSNSDDRSREIVLDNSNSAYLCGSKININSLSDFFCAKVNSGGNIEWEYNFNGASGNIDIPGSIAIDNQRNVYLTGYSRNDTMIGSEDILTIKLFPNGTEDWRAIYDGPANGIDQGNSVKVDNDGYVYVGGASDMGNIHLAYRLLKYTPAGILNWTDDYFASNISEDFIYELHLDKLKNIFVTGISLGIGTNFDFATIKYSQTVGIQNNLHSVPGQFYLSQNYPNPFNPITRIEYGLLKTAHVKILLNDVTGKEILTLTDKQHLAGAYSVELDGKNLQSGVYFYTLLIEGEVAESRKMILLK